MLGVQATRLRETGVPGVVREWALTAQLGPDLPSLPAPRCCSSSTHGGVGTGAQARDTPASCGFPGREVPSWVCGSNLSTEGRIGTANMLPKRAVRVRCCVRASVVVCVSVHVCALPPHTNSHLTYPYLSFSPASSPPRRPAPSPWTPTTGHPRPRRAPALLPLGLLL